MEDFFSKPNLLPDKRQEFDPLISNGFNQHPFASPKQTQLPESLKIDLIVDSSNVRNKLFYLLRDCIHLLQMHPLQLSPHLLPLFILPFAIRIYIHFGLETRNLVQDLQTLGKIAMNLKSDSSSGTTSSETSDIPHSLKTHSLQLSNPHMLHGKSINSNTSKNDNSGVLKKLQKRCIQILILFETQNLRDGIPLDMYLHLRITQLKLSSRRQKSRNYSRFASRFDPFPSTDLLQLQKILESLRFTYSLPVQSLYNIDNALHTLSKTNQIKSNNLETLVISQLFKKLTTFGQEIFSDLSFDFCLQEKLFDLTFIVNYLSYSLKTFNSTLNRTLMQLGREKYAVSLFSLLPLVPASYRLLTKYCIYSLYRYNFPETCKTIQSLSRMPRDSYHEKIKVNNAVQQVPNIPYTPITSSLRSSKHRLKLNKSSSPIPTLHSDSRRRRPEPDTSFDIITRDDDHYSRSTDSSVNSTLSPQLLSDQINSIRKKPKKSWKKKKKKNIKKRKKYSSSSDSFSSSDSMSSSDEPITPLKEMSDYEKRLYNIFLGAKRTRKNMKYTLPSDTKQKTLNFLEQSKRRSSKKKNHSPSSKVALFSSTPLQNTSAIVVKSQTVSAEPTQSYSQPVQPIMVRSLSDSSNTSKATLHSSSYYDQENNIDSVVSPPRSSSFRSRSSSSSSKSINEKSNSKLYIERLVKGTKNKPSNASYRQAVSKQLTKFSSQFILPTPSLGRLPVSITKNSRIDPKPKQNPLFPNVKNAVIPSSNVIIPETPLTSSRSDAVEPSFGSQRKLF